MRVDKVWQREYSIRQFQLMVNDLVKKSLTKEQIELELDKLKISLREVNTGEETNIIPPKVTLEPSHLKKGYAAFFKCPQCLRKVRTLYYIRGLLACRISHGLTYKKQDKRQITVNRLIWDDELREKYYNSWSTSRIRKAMEAEYALEEIQNRGYEIADGIIRKIERNKNSVSK